MTASTLKVKVAHDTEDRSVANLFQRGSLSVSEVYERLKTWSMDSIKRYMVHKDVYSADIIDAIQEEYIRYLSLSIVYSGQVLPISRYVDDFWHTHILFTKDYVQMSEYVTGKYIHHQPAWGEALDRLEHPFAALTLTKYREHFGEPNPKYWDMQCCGQCNCPP